MAVPAVGGGTLPLDKCIKYRTAGVLFILMPLTGLFGYSENNTEGEEAARREALANCISSGGGKNPIARSGEGCHLMTEYRNACGAIALGGVKGSGRVFAHGAASIKEAEQKAINGCERNQSFKCTVRYSGCSYHPDYRR